MKELRALRRATKVNRRMESNSRDMMNMLKEEVSELRRATQNQQSQQMNSTRNVPIYPDLRGEPAMLREFLHSMIEPYQLDANQSCSTPSLDSGNNSVEDNAN